MDNHLINHFIESMNSLTSENITTKLNEIYTHDIEFIDPIKNINGLNNLTDYFANLYKSVEHCHFDITNHLHSDNVHSLQWLMTLKHQRLNKKKEILLDGASFLRFDNEKVCYHRDYYDMGALVYERLPLLGSAVKTVRNAF